MTKSIFLAPWIAAFGLLLSACSGSGLVTLGNAGADSRFASYSVQIDSIVLTSSTGSTKQVLSQATQVDLADPAQTALLLAAPGLSSTKYSSGTITIDYTSANIVLNVAGVPTQVQVVDATGAAVTQVQVPIQFGALGSLSSSTSASSRLALSFDLTASNAVDLTVSPAKVTVRPAVIAIVDPADAPEIALTGTLGSVSSSSSSTSSSSTANTVTLTLPNSDTVKVQVTDSTQFEVSGTTYTGSAGTSALGTLGNSAPVEVFGALVSGQFTADRMLAGTSIASDTVASLSGTVIAESANTLTVRGGRLNSDDGTVTFLNYDVPVTVGTSTIVTESAQSAITLFSESISIGQQITALGVTNSGSSGDVTLDATSGVVRLENTTGWGLLLASSSGSLTLNLQQLEGLPPSVFNFAGTQANGGTGNPGGYVVTTGALDLTGLGGIGSLTQFSGVVAPFSAAPPNFIADAATAGTAAPANLLVRWAVGGGAAVLTTLNATEIVVNASSPLLGTDHLVQLGPQATNLSTLATPPPIVADTSVSDQFAIQNAAGTVTMYSSFAAFTAALQSALTATTSLTTLSAQGYYGGGSFQAWEILAQLQ